MDNAYREVPNLNFGQRSMGYFMSLSVIWQRVLRYELSSHSNAGIVGSNLTQGMEVSVCFFSMIVLSCV
jgi:hypothetical protein